MHTPDSIAQTRLTNAEKSSSRIVDDIRRRIATLSSSKIKGLTPADAIRLRTAAEVLQELDGDLTDVVFGVLGKGLKLPTGPKRTPSRPPEVTSNVDRVIASVIDQLPYDPAIRSRIKNLLASIGIRTHEDLQLFSEKELENLPIIGRHHASVAQMLQKEGIALATEANAAHPPLSAPVAKLHTLEIARFDLRDHVKILALNQNIGLTLNDVAQAVDSGRLIPGHLFTEKQIGKITDFIRRIQLPQEGTK
ncbi:hypothetical protein KBB08_00580 [Candidatus Gracilibacteria bacterium]|nr:hypothetical protein [Candidatus Gracilibacteria bacterium]